MRLRKHRINRYSVPVSYTFSNDEREQRQEIVSLTCNPYRHYDRFRQVVRDIARNCMAGPLRR
jgi:hypothetical protein